jgi:hypothetical protein
LLTFSRYALKLKVVARIFLLVADLGVLGPLDGRMPVQQRQTRQRGQRRQILR